jgi:hypothetical protein
LLRAFFLSTSAGQDTATTLNRADAQSVPTC